MFLQTALSFPTIMFSVAVLACAGYWLLSLLTGVGDGLDLDIDLDVDVDGSADGVLGAVLGGLHLTGVPPVIILSLTATFAWLVSYSASVVFDLAGRSGLTVLLGSIVLALVSVVVGLLAAAVAARPIARVFTYTRATSHTDLVGRLCVIRTGSVSEGFGQAEVSLAGGTVLLVQVRAEEPNGFASGAHALLVDYDAQDGTFQIASADGLEPDALDG